MDEKGEKRKMEKEKDGWKGERIERRGKYGALTALPLPTKS